MIWKHRHVVVDNLTPPPKRKHDKMGSGALPLSTSDYLPTPLWLNSWTNTSCSQSDIPFDCNCIYWLVSKDHYNGLFFSTAPTWIGLVAIIIPKIHGWHFFPPKKNLYVYLLICILSTICSERPKHQNPACLGQSQIQSTVPSVPPKFGCKDQGSRPRGSSYSSWSCWCIFGQSSRSPVDIE